MLFIKMPLLRKVLLLCYCAVNVNTLTIASVPKPKYNKYADVARWAIARAQFGVLSTTSIQFNKVPWGKYVAVSDGIHSDSVLENSTGTPYFYLTELAQSGRNIAEYPKASFAVSQATFTGENYCKAISAEDPTCVGVTLSGNMVTVTDKNDRQFGLNALYSKHPMMKSWPDDHGWLVFKLNITNVWILDFYGGSHTVSQEEYFSGKP